MFKYFMNKGNHITRSVIALLLWCFSYSLITTWQPVSTYRLEQAILSTDASALNTSNVLAQKGKETEQKHIIPSCMVVPANPGMLRVQFNLLNRAIHSTLRPLSLYLIYTEITASRL